MEEPVENKSASTDITPPAADHAKSPLTQSNGAAVREAAAAAEEGADVRRFQVMDTEANLPYGYCNNYVKTSKYTVANFIFKNLSEQFRRVANAYFLVISAFQLIPGVSPTGQYTTIVPLTIVLLVTAIKEAIEDRRRHKQDKEINNRQTDIIRDGKPMTVSWEDVLVGDLVKVKNKEYIPADLLIVSSSEAQGVCYIETANLDGETNLKDRQALPETAALNSEELLGGLRHAKVQCEKPNQKLYHFDGRIEWDTHRLALSARQLLLRGAQLRNTKWIYGVAVFTGADSKLMKNSSKPPVKRTRVEKMVNRQVLTMFVMLGVMAIVCTIGYGIWQGKFGLDAWYLQFSSSSAARETGLAIITFVILFNNLIPISLYITVELCKVGQAFFINNDIEMYHAENDTPALARTSNLNEELGQVEYIFSDKTGTLTANKMEFKYCTFAGQVYGRIDLPEDLASPQGSKIEVNQGAVVDELPIEDADTLIVEYSPYDDSLRQATAARGGDSGGQSTPLERTSRSSIQRQVKLNSRDDSGRKSEAGEEFGKLLFDGAVLMSDMEKHQDEEVKNTLREACLLLSVCHTVIPEKNMETGSIQYQASSPDEGALVLAASVALGHRFRERSPKTVTVEIEGKDQVFEILNVLEFNNVRKRMSVIVRTPSGKIMLYCKGADNVIYERLAAHNPYKEITKQHLREFASEGLRTLCLACVELPKDKYQKWNEQYWVPASTRVVGREDALVEAAELMEKELFLLGATAVEDRLQDGVPEAIATLAQAGLKIWVLTGDKQETAINIGFSCRLLTDRMKMMVINVDPDSDAEEQKKQLEAGLQSAEKEVGEVLTKHEKERVQLALVIDGTTLLHALEDTYKMRLLQVGVQCKAVICCRVSPLQKALVVRLVRQNMKAITLAIGDGANDVSMIQAAHVGVGISGEEGLQAARAADYSIAQFRFLKRLLLVHGRWSYRRIAKVVAYSFFKNVLLQLTQFWFVFFNGFSGQSLYERWSLSVYNIFFTFAPILIFGTQDQDIRDQHTLVFPHLYRSGQRQVHFNYRVFWAWISTAVVDSALIFFLTIGAMQNGVLHAHGRVVADNWVQGDMMYHLVIAVVTLRLALEAKHWTWLLQLALGGSVVVFMLWHVIFNYIGKSGLLAGDFYYVPWNLYRSGTFWLMLILVPVCCLLRDVTWKYAKRTYYPQPYHIVQELQSLKIKSKRKQIKLRAPRRKLAGDRTGYAFEAPHADPSMFAEQMGMKDGQSAASAASLQPDRELHPPDDKTQLAEEEIED